jgi:uncharacterized protein (UPF0335 family)
MSIGHNSEIGGQIKALVERIENIETEIKALNEDKRDIFSEAKGQGLDVAVLKKVIQLRRMDPAKRAEMETILDLYWSAIGEA